MKKQLAIAIIISMFLILPTAGAYQLWDIREAELTGETVQSGCLNHLMLREKNPDTWQIIGDNWGRLVWASEDGQGFLKNQYQFNAVIRADDGESNADRVYSLIYYPDIGKIKLDFNLNDAHYVHTMIIQDYDFDTDQFSGIGTYDPDNSYTWTVSGTWDSFTIVYTGTNAGYTVLTDGNEWSSSSGQEGTFTKTNTGIDAEIWGRPVLVIGKCTSNEFENVYFANTFNFESIPSFFDINPGAKIWLVPSECIVNGELAVWSPTEFLFETELIYQ